MRFNPGLCAASLVVASSLSLIGAARPAQTPNPNPAPAQAAATTRTLPIWAYPVNPPRVRPAEGAPAIPRTPRVVDNTPIKVANSNAPAMPQAQISDLFVVPDWFPDAHPKMPAIVAEGRKPEIGACGHCHLPTGYGRPENESVAGLPAAYMLEQLNDFKNGLRHSSEPRMGSVALMVNYAKDLTPEEEKAAVDYFASIKPVKWIRVVETDTVPKTHPSGGMLVVDEGTEPIGERVIEVAEDYKQFELRNPTSGFIAYVPVGSLKAGEALVKTGGNGETMACTMCHGSNLKGVGNIPSIAGRSPSQMTRQLIDFQTGARNGAMGQMMKMPVAKLTNADIVDITGYLASLEP
ncbi:MAG: c-type cytochrome [Granulicella sp.]